MKITDIQVDRFGVWRSLTLPLSSSGLNVFYGPNEAGKTTLLRFVRGILYGFEPFGVIASDADGSSAPCEGQLRVDHYEQPCKIRRVSHRDSPGLLSVTGLDRDVPASELLTELLSETEQPVFDHVFAIGLQELQQLATLERDDVASQLYSISLGHEGRRLLRAGSQAEIQRDRLLNPRDRSGELVELFDRYDQLSAELEQFANQRERYAELCTERDRLAALISGLKTRQAGMQSQLRGHTFLERVWAPWNRVRILQAELDELPKITGFPEDGPARLDELDTDLAAANKCREALLSEAAEFRKAAAALHIDPEIQKHAATIQSFIDQRDWVLELAREMKEADANANDLKAELTTKIGRLGPDWSLARLEKVDPSPSAHFRMVKMARRFRSARARRAKLRRRLKRLSDATQKRMADFNEQLKKLGGQSIDDALHAARRKLADLEDLGRLKLRRAELEQRWIGINDQLSRLKERLSLPKWVYAFLTFFGVSGIVFAVLGIVTGVITSGLGGAAYALVATLCVLMARALTSHFEGEVHDRVEQLQDELRENEVRLRETRTAIDRITVVKTALPSMPVETATPSPHAIAPSPLPIALVVASPTAGDPSSQPTTPAQITEADLVHQTTRRLTELEQLAETQQRIQKARRKLSELRNRFQRLQRDVSTARQNWCELLTESGFSETVRTGEAFEVWQRVVEAHEQRRIWQATTAEVQDRQAKLQSFRRRIEELGRRVHCWDFDDARPLDVLTAWEEKLKILGQNQSQRRRLRREEKARRRELAEYHQRVDELKMQRSALLVRGGSATREEFEQRAQLVHRRRELEELRAAAASDLETAAQAEPELAVVEKDLLAYDPEQNSQCIKTLNLELEEIEREQQQAFEKLGGQKQEIKELENDIRPTQLRFERELVAEKIKRALEKWFAVGLADQAIDRIRTRFERTCQPVTLTDASQFLERLTGGKYRSIWTPLGKRHLSIDDDQNETFLVDQLSGGTREQLFLAIRLALVRDFARKGVELPMVLDDILVNFDQLRTEAAVETLIDFAREGQQILLFTCHLHLAHMFESKGIEPIWLPGHSPPIEERRAG